MTKYIDSYCSIEEKLWSGQSVWCICGHHVNMHKTIPLSNNDDYIDSICRFDNGHFVCPCTGFESNTTTILTATNGQDRGAIPREK